MSNHLPSFLKQACYFEASLIIVAYLIGLFANIDPFEWVIFSETAIFNGMIATLPLLLLFFAIEQLPFKSLRDIRILLLNNLCAHLTKQSWADLCLLAGLAGIGEELLFRGVIQIWIENVWGISAAIIITSLLFALVHAITPIYALLAAMISVYLGLSLDYDASRNLLTPIIIHGLYDFIMLNLLMYQYRQLTAKKDETQNPNSLRNP